MIATETALIVPVPEAEPVVGRWRALADRAASWGVPAHITVLYPFLAPELIDETVVRDLAGIVRAVPRFDVTLSHVDWFEQRVVWVAPRPDEPFRDLTHAVWRRFPEAPPYRGQVDGVIPHLTVAHDGDPALLRRAADEVSARLPVRAAVDRVHLVAGTAAAESWHTIADLPLA